MTSSLRLYAKYFCTSILCALMTATLSIVSLTSAQACACCTQTAWRRVEIEKLDSNKLAEMEQVKFAKAAQLMLGEADDGIKGVKDPEQDYQLTVARQKDRWSFSFSDGKGRSGTLQLSLPKTISIFEVDPRHGKDEGQGPLLYKEWKVTVSAVGDGIFRASTGGNQKLTLVLHGGGNGCTSSVDFTHWTLLVHGPVDTYTLYGALEAGSQ